MKYEGKAVSIHIGSATRIELPPLIYRGRLVGMLFDSDKTFLLPAAILGFRLSAATMRIPGRRS